MSSNTWQYEGKYSNIQIPDPGAGNKIAIGDRIIGYCALVGASDTRTLAAPTRPGQQLTLCLDTDTSGTCIVTSDVGLNVTGHLIITFTNLGETIFLVAVTEANVLRWQDFGADGAPTS